MDSTSYFFHGISRTLHTSYKFSISRNMREWPNDIHSRDPRIPNPVRMSNCNDGNSAKLRHIIHGSTASHPRVRCASCTTASPLLLQATKILVPSCRSTVYQCSVVNSPKLPLQGQLPLDVNDLINDLAPRCATRCSVQGRGPVFQFIYFGYVATSPSLTCLSLFGLHPCQPSG